jgi:hypothetical protein
MIVLTNTDAATAEGQQSGPARKKIPAKLDLPYPESPIRRIAPLSPTTIVPCRGSMP